MVLEIFHLFTSCYTVLLPCSIFFFNLLQNVFYANEGPVVHETQLGKHFMFQCWDDD